MSDTSWSLSVPPEGGVPGRPGSAFHGGNELLDAVVPLLHGWLPRQRWFAGKGRPIAGIRLLDATELAGASPTAAGLLHLLVQVRHRPPDDPGRADPASDTANRAGRTGRAGRLAAEPLGPLGAGAPEPVGSPLPQGYPGDCYQLLLGTTTAVHPGLTPALIGRIDGGRHDGLYLYDAPHDPQLAGKLLALLAADGAVNGLRFHRLPQTPLPTGLTSRVNRAEQSNTSVVYGDTLILKVFRAVSPGTNPDLELSLALAGAGCHRVPAPVAWFDMRWPGDGGQADEITTLGLLQRFLPGAADGWELALASVPHGSGPLNGGDFTGESYALGRTTAEIHTVLAQELPGARLTGAQIGELAEDMARRLAEAAEAVPALRPYRAALNGAFRDLAELGCAGRTLPAQRIHGDLHLGQALRTTDGWMLLDFEGEPARPLADRRRPQPAVRDVAAMLRSFDYAARYHLVTPAGDGGAVDMAGAEEWARRNRAAFCAGYAAVGDQDPRAEQALVRAFETDKAVYEVLYEARHRPSWLPVPLSAIKRLAAPTR